MPSLGQWLAEQRGWPWVAEFGRQHWEDCGGVLSSDDLLTIARTLMGNPDVLLLDEPSEGLAPIIVQAIGDLIRTLRETGVTIVLAEQNMHFCLGISEDAAVIDKGHIVYRDTIAGLRANEEVTKRYLAI